MWVPCAAPCGGYTCVEDGLMPQVALAVSYAVSGAVVAIGGGTFAALTVGVAFGTAAFYATIIFLLNTARGILN